MEKHLIVMCLSGHNSFIYLLKGELKIGEKNHNKTGDSNLILLERGKKA